MTFIGGGRISFSIKSSWSLPGRTRWRRGCDKMQMHRVWDLLLTSICKFGVRWASVIMDDTLDTVGRYFMALMGLIGGSKHFQGVWGWHLRWGQSRF